MQTRSGKSTYDTHNNGMTPYRVVDNPSAKRITVSESNDSLDSDEENDMDNGIYIQKYHKPCLNFKYEQIWIGNGNVYGIKKQDDFSLGNAILVQQDAKTIIFIGHDIQEISLTDNEFVTEFVSLVGNNDVPYPYFLTNKWCYLILENIKIPIEMVPARKTLAPRVWWGDYGLLGGQNITKEYTAYQYYYDLLDDARQQEKELNFPTYVSKIL